MEAIAHLARRISELERRVSSQMRHGTVEEVDAAKGLVRMRLGEEGGTPFIGPWVPYSQMAGGFKAHIPPTVGQQMTMLSPTGEFEQAVAMPMTWSNQNQSPSDKPDENVITYGNVTITIKDNLFKVQVGGVTYDFTGQGIDVNGGHIKHDGKKIDSGHIHGGVIPGGGETDVPAN